MNAELPPFKNGKHNFESASTLDRDITPLNARVAKGSSPSSTYPAFQNTFCNFVLYHWTICIFPYNYMSPKIRHWSLMQRKDYYNLSAHAQSYIFSMNSFTESEACVQDGPRCGSRAQSSGDFISRRSPSHHTRPPYAGHLLRTVTVTVCCIIL